jgi:FkbM family methyltransferase
MINDKYVNFEKLHYNSCLDLVNKYSHYLKHASIIDIGSNIGLFAKAIASTIEYTHIHLFEPSCEYLNQSKNILNSFKNITYNNIALGDYTQTLSLYKSRNYNIGWNTLYKKDPNQNNNFINEMDSEEVSVVRLDDYYSNINQVDFIKIDVEGYECNVLEGSWDIIKKFNPFLLIEVAWGTNHPDWNSNLKTYEKLFTIGYHRVLFSNNTQDILFIPINK